MKNQLLKIALFVGIPAILFAASARIKDFGTTATTIAGDDYIPMDGATNGTRKILGARFLTNATITGTGNSVLDTSPTFPGNLTITGNATPATTTAGTISFDTNAWAASRGSLQVYDGTANIVLLGTLASDAPSNGQVPTWNTGGTITWENAGTGNVTNNATLASGNLVIGGGTSVVGTTNIVVTGGNNISLGNLTAATLNATSVTGVFLGANGGTGIANTGKTITLGGNLETSGANNIVLTTSGATNVTLPTTGTLATVAGTIAAVTPGTSGNVLTSNGTAWTSAAPTGGNGTLSAGIGTLWPTAGIGSPPTGFFAAGDYGTTANTALGDWSIIVASGGTVATPTANVAPGAVASGTVVTFSSATSGLTNFRSTTNGTDPSYTVGTAGNSVTVTANNTYEVVANKQGWVTSAVASFAYTIAAGTSYSDEVLADSPLGYWRLGETSGTSAADLGSVNQAGTYSGGYTLNQTSLLTTDTANKSILLNGSSGYVDAGTNAAFNLNGSNITVECLVNFSAFPASGADAYLIAKAYDSGSSETGYALYVAVTGGGSTKTLNFSSYDGSSHGTSYDVSAWTTGTTYHVAGTWDGSNWKLYVNGSNVATTADATGPQSSTRPFSIGRESNSFANQAYLNGYIDEVAVYNTALSAARILAHHDAR